MKRNRLLPFFFCSVCQLKFLDAKQIKEEKQKNYTLSSSITNGYVSVPKRQKQQGF